MAGVPDVLGWRGRVPRSLWDCSSRCCCGEQDPCLPSDVHLFWTDLTLWRACVLFSPEVANEMRKTRWPLHVNLQKVFWI